MCLTEFVTMPLPSSILNSIFRYYKCSSIDVEEIRMSSKYDSQKSNDYVVDKTLEWYGTFLSPYNVRTNLI